MQDKPGEKGRWFFRRRRYKPGGRGQQAASQPVSGERPRPKPAPRPVREPEHILVQRLGIRPGFLVSLLNPPTNFYTEISKQLPPSCRLQVGFPRQPTMGVVIYWPESGQGLEDGLSWLKTRITEEGAILVIISKHNSKDPSLTQEVVRNAASKAGLINDRQISMNENEVAFHLVIKDSRG